MATEDTATGEPNPQAVDLLVEILVAFLVDEHVAAQVVNAEMDN